MIENPLKKVLVKRASLRGTLRGMSDADRAAYEQQVNQRRAEAEQREALIDKYLPAIIDPSQPIPDEIKPILQEVLGEREIDNWEDWNKGFRGWRYGKNGRVIDAYGKRISAKYDLFGNLKVPTKELIPSATAETPSTPASELTLLQNPLGNTSINVTDFNKPYSLDDVRALSEANLSASAPSAASTQNSLADTTINVADYNKPYSLDDARAIVTQGLDGKPATPAATGVTNSTAVSAETPSATPAAAARDAAGVPTSASTPTPKTVRTQKPTGLTREETMQFLEQGYVPTSVGGYALNEQKAADTLRAMQQNPNLNPGAVITDADRLNRIRTTMLGNEQHTAQGRQLEADMAALNDYEYHQKHMAQQNAANDSQVAAYGNSVYRDIHDEIMRKGKNQAMRRVGGEAYAGEAADRQRLGLPANTPITPEEQYYNKYIEAENNGTALPELPKAYNRQYNRQLAQYRGQLRPSAPAQTSVRPRHHNYMTGQEMNDYVASQRGNIVENNWKSLSPERQAAARQARAARQAARSNGVPQQTATPTAKPTPVAKQPTAAGAPASPTTTNPLNKAASIRKPLINPFLR